MSEERGYLYRVARAHEQQLRELIKNHVGSSGWAFGGAAGWDFNPGLADLRENLRPIEPFADVATIDVGGDFGHAFSVDVEVRWKRRDDGAYDVLVLSKDLLDVAGGQPLRMRHQNSQTGVWEDGEWSVRHHAVAEIRQTAERPPIAYVDYVAPNGTTQFQRLAGVKP